MTIVADARKLKGFGIKIDHSNDSLVDTCEIYKLAHFVYL